MSDHDSPEAPRKWQKAGEVYTVEVCSENDVSFDVMFLSRGPTPLKIVYEISNTLILI